MIPVIKILNRCGRRIKCVNHVTFIERRYQQDRRLHDKPLPKEHCKPKVYDTGHCKVALITGGATGIGLASALQLLKGGAKGAVLVGNNCCEGREAVECLNAKCGRDKAIFVKTDVCNLKELEEAFKAAVDKYGQVDIVLNAAGVCDGGQWEKEVRTNLVGTIRGTLLAFQYVGKQGSGKGGTIINISGLTGLRPFVAAPTLSATHHGIVGLSRSFGDTYHLNKSGIRVVTLCPGATQTNFIRKIYERAMTNEMGDQLQKEIDDAVKQCPDVCGQAVMHLLKYGKPGSVWAIEGSRLFLLDLPDPLKRARLVAQFL